MEEKTLLNFHGLEVRLSDRADEGIINILNNAVQGSEGGLRFSLQNVAGRIREYGDRIRFISLYRKNRITGTVGACFRISGQGQLRYPTTYIRYLAFQSLYQASPRFQNREKSTAVSDREDTFKKKTLDLFSRPHLLGIPEVFEQDKHVMYAFVESMNERSKNIVHQAGYEQIRSFLTVAFSRFSPKADSRISKLHEGDRQGMKSLLLDFYRDYSFYSADHSFSGTYYVLKEGDEIIAGVNAIPSLYRIYNMPGIWGWVMMKVLPGMPYFRRLFSPGEFRYLVFDSIYCRKGREEELTTLFESACALEGFHTGLTWLDDKGELFEHLRTDRKMGALNRMLNAKPGLVYARFLNFTENEKEPFYNAPAYVSGFDFS